MFSKKAVAAISFCIIAVAITLGVHSINSAQDFRSSATVGDYRQNNGASNYGSTSPIKPAQPADTIRLPFSKNSFLTLLVAYADEYGFFAQENLNVVLDDGYKFGPEYIAGLVSGNLDYAFTSHSNAIDEVLSGESIVVVGSVAQAREHIAIVYDNEVINTISDLEGATIATPKETGAAYFLSLFADFHELENITIVNSSPDRILESLEQPEIQAAAIWNPIWHKILSGNSDQYSVFLDEGIFTTYFVLVADQTRLVNPMYVERMRRLTNALERAAADLARNPERGIAVLASDYDLTIDLAESIVANYLFEYSFDTRMLKTMQDELDWKTQKSDTETFPIGEIIYALQQP